MGRTKKRHNWKARQKDPKTQQTDSESKIQQQVNVEINIDETKYDNCNALILPSKKEKSTLNKLSKTITQQQILSNKKRKKIEKILARKHKKQNGSVILNDLQKFQINDKEMKNLVPVSVMQTRGLKRHFQEADVFNNFDIVDDEKQNGNEKTLNLLNVKRLKTKWSSSKDIESKSSNSDPNVVGFEIEESETASSSESEEEKEESKDDNFDKKEINCEVENSNNTSGEKEETQALQKTTENEKSLPKDIKNVASKNSLPNNSSALSRTPAVFKSVNRRPEIEKARSFLPIISEEQIIMEAINENSIVIICGETGSGKTTQIPQFLYEAGYTQNKKLIGITEPRRVSAIAMSERVGDEMNLKSLVSYQIRYEGNCTAATEIKFMTDGVLLKEIEADFLLSKYSVIIVDEAHERSVYSDIIIGLLSRIVPLREKKGMPLKFIIMSATLRVEDFTENTKLFRTPPKVLKIESRQYPVTIHFNKHTPDDYIQEAYRKVCKIHQTMPSGGILVFVTGQQEVYTLLKRLRHSTKISRQKPTFSSENKKQIKKAIGPKKGSKSKDLISKTLAELTPKINLDNYVMKTLDETDDIDEDNDDIDISSDEEDCSKNNFSEPLYCLPLYAMLPQSKQKQIFENPPEGSRLCVIATNVAETSITIPNIKYVVDTGKIKTKLYDKVTGISVFDISWTSKASADQRAGRAGRTSAGHCYRLYSSAIFNDNFSKFLEPAILQKPIDDLLLQMKVMNIENVVNFPFPSPPSPEALLASEKRLIQLGALEKCAKSLRLRDIKSERWDSKASSLGKAISCFPVSPRFGKMLTLSVQHNLLEYVIAIVATMTVQEVFLDNYFSDNSTTDVQESNFHKKKERWTNLRKKWAGQGQSRLLGDVMVLLKAAGASEYANCQYAFCETNGLRHKAVLEIHNLRRQLTREANSILPDLAITVDPNMSPPTESVAKLLRQIVLCGLFDHVARRMKEGEIPEEKKHTWKGAYQCTDMDQPVFLTSNSVLKDVMPEFLVYQEIFESSKCFMRVVSAIEPEWLPIYAPKLCTFSKPLEKPFPRFDSDEDCIKCQVTSTFGPHSWPISAVEVDFPREIECYKWFAKFLLEGDVVTYFKSYNSTLLSRPNVMVKSWANLLPRTQKLLSSLLQNDICSKKELTTKWGTNPEFLLPEYLQWLPEALHEKVKSSWPPQN